MPEASRSRSLRRHAPGRQAGDRAILSSRAQRGILRRTTSPARDAGDRDVDRYSEERSDEGTLDASHPDPGSLLAALVRDDIYNAREDAPCRPERPAGGGTLFRGSAYKGPSPRLKLLGIAIDIAVARIPPAGRRDDRFKAVRLMRFIAHRTCLHGEVQSKQSLYSSLENGIQSVLSIPLLWLSSVGNAEAIFIQR
ncbi:MAG: hypothetical protein BWY99_02099 [Synergistetes bacterium ADurb.BinA166]|nr:MAG: hypothetical protein BWY99_02099 [Synergistetes bacterium ADurb.BinA166]